MRPKALTESQRRLVEQNIGLAGCAAARFRRSGKTVGLELDDLFSIACMGLVYGAQRYDPAVSRPGTYLFDCCQWMLLTELRHRRRKCRAGTVYSLDMPVVMGREVVTYGDLLMGWFSCSSRFCWRSRRAISSPRFTTSASMRS